jgi:hypothetical protein
VKRFFAALLLLGLVCAAQSHIDDGVIKKHVLKAFREPSMAKIATQKSKESYRFVYIRTFHHPIAVRVEVNADGTGTVFMKETSGQGGYGMGKLIRSRTIAINAEAMKGVLEEIEKSNFWNEPFEEKQNEDVIQLDGAEWTFEGAKDGKYHAVSRWSPDCDRARAFKKLGTTFLFYLANLRIPYTQVY